ncbi:hypothetical protein B0H17DRAFT_1197496 [Mycena rosella]|uniref:Uncharacterized protein n=1 Tax=Mycena rosella TaxID=1033263 RepID=A0AAD7DRP5_MYCRO|nr:hypothetical protein B0H17DRAFT_1197496 [Mycena rosella]
MSPLVPFTFERRRVLLNPLPVRFSTALSLIAFIKAALHTPMLAWPGRQSMSAKTVFHAGHQDREARPADMRRRGCLVFDEVTNLA